MSIYDEIERMQRMVDQAAGGPEGRAIADAIREQSNLAKYLAPPANVVSETAARHVRQAVARSEQDLAVAKVISERENIAKYYASAANLADEIAAKEVRQVEALLEQPNRDLALAIGCIDFGRLATQITERTSVVDPRHAEFDRIARSSLDMFRQAEETLRQSRALDPLPGLLPSMSQIIADIERSQRELTVVAVVSDPSRIAAYLDPLWRDIDALADEMEKLAGDGALTDLSASVDLVAAYRKAVGVALVMLSWLKKQIAANWIAIALEIGHALTPSDCERLAERVEQTQRVQQVEQRVQARHQFEIRKTTTEVRLRTAPRSDSDEKAMLLAETLVLVTEHRDGWYSVVVHSGPYMTQTGWVHGDYLVLMPTEGG